MMLAVGTVTARDAIDNALTHADTWLHLGGILKIDWGFYRGGFFTLFAGTAPVFWIFFLMTGIFDVCACAPAIPKSSGPSSFNAPWYPLLPMIFCGMCLFGF